MTMTPTQFIPYLYLMKAGYDHSSENTMFEWIRSRTDDVAIVEDNETFTVIILGTEPTIGEWIQNFNVRSVEWLNIGRVHGGFAKNVHELLGREDQPNSVISKAIKASLAGKKILLCGHSRANALIQLAATQFVAHGVNKDLITVIGCGGVRIGNARFKKAYKAMLGERTFVLNGKNDPVRFVPFWGSQNAKQTLIDLGGYRPKHLLKHYIKRVHEIQS